MFIVSPPPRPEYINAVDPANDTQLWQWRPDQNGATPAMSRFFGWSMSWIWQPRQWQVPGKIPRISQSTGLRSGLFGGHGAGPTKSGVCWQQRNRLASTWAGTLSYWKVKKPLTTSLFLPPVSIKYWKLTNINQYNCNTNNINNKDVPFWG